MKKILYLLILFCAFGYSQTQATKTDVIAFQGNVTTTIRDAFDVPTGEYWLIFNTTTDRLEVAGDDDVWSAFTAGGADQLGSDLDRGDATISGSGTVLTIDNGAVTGAKILDGTIESIDIASSTITGSDIANSTITAIDLADDSVSESELNSGNAPVDEYSLTYEADTGGFEWQLSSGTDASLSETNQTILTGVVRDVNTSGTGTLSFSDTATELMRIGNNNDEAVYVKALEVLPGGGNTIALTSPFAVPIVNTGAVAASGYDRAIVEDTTDGELYASIGSAWTQLTNQSGGSSLPVSDATSIAEGSVDATKEVRFEVDGLTTGTVRVLTVQDSDGTIALTSDLTPYAQTTDFDTFAELDAIVADKTLFNLEDNFQIDGDIVFTNTVNHTGVLNLTTAGQDSEALTITNTQTDGDNRILMTADDTGGTPRTGSFGWYAKGISEAYWAWSRDAVDLEIPAMRLRRNTGDLFLYGDLTLDNDAHTFDVTFTNAVTADRTLTLPDQTGTVAITTDIELSKVGTMANNEVVIATGDGTLESESDVTYDGTDFEVSSSTGDARFHANTSAAASQAGFDFTSVGGSALFELDQDGNLVFRNNSTTGGVYFDANNATGDIFFRVASLGITALLLDQAGDATFAGDIDASTGSVTVTTETYNESTWNGNNTVPTKDAVRDQFESIVAGSLPTSDANSIVEGSVDATKELRFEVDNIATATTIVVTAPTSNLDLNDVITSDLTGEPPGSDQVLNQVSLTQAELDAGTPVAGTVYHVTDAKVEYSVTIPLTAIGGDVATGTDLNFWEVHDAITITKVAGFVKTAGVGSTITIDIHEDGTTIMTTNKINIDTTENWSSDAATQPTLTDTAINANSVLTFDIDAADSGNVGTDPSVTIWYTVD